MATNESGANPGDLISHTPVNGNGADPQSSASLPASSDHRDKPRRGRTAHEKHVIALSVVPFLALTVSATVGGLFLVQSESRLAPAAFTLAASSLLSCVVVPALLAREIRMRKDEEDQSNSHCAQMGKALEHLENRTLAGLANVNFTQMSQFVAIAQKQARMSYYASLVAASVGFLALVTGTAASAGVGMPSAKITAAILTAAGAVLSGFLTRTFVRTYTMSSRQLSYYYGQPLVHCYLLHAVWLASEAFNRFPTDNETRDKLIDAALAASHTAQTHLLTMQGEKAMSSKREAMSDRK